MSRLKVPPEKKVHYVEMYKRGRGSEMTLAKAAGVSLASFQQWLRNYEVYGAEAFTKGYQHYTLELKTNAVRDYLNGEGSQDAICKKYGIRSKSKLQNWITVYNSHGELRSSHRRRSAIVTKGRKTTFEERLSIVADCIAGGLDYKDFSWSEPPDGGHPGWSYRCRCVAIPLYDTDKIGLQPKAGSYKKV